MLNFSKFLKAFNDILSRAGVKYNVLRTVLADQKYPYIYMDNSDQTITQLKGGASEDGTMINYNETDFILKIVDQSRDFSKIEKLTEDLIKATDDSQKRFPADLKIIGIRVTTLAQQYTHEEKTGIAFLVGYKVLHN